jgi:hypothetical protein
MSTAVSKYTSGKQDAAQSIPTLSKYESYQLISTKLEQLQNQCRNTYESNSLK